MMRKQMRNVKRSGGVAVSDRSNTMEQVLTGTLPSNQPREHLHLVKDANGGQLASAFHQAMDQGKAQ